MATDRGASLVETMVALLFIGLCASVVHQFARTMLHSVRLLELASEAQEAARIGVYLITADLRCAGYSAATDLGNGVRSARVDAIEVESDLTGDGDTDDANEIIGYNVDLTTRTLRRTMGNAASQPLLSDVAAGGLTFAYFAEDGTAIPMTDGAAAAGDRRRIRRVDLVLGIAIVPPEPLADGPLRATQTTTVALRNG